MTKHRGILATREACPGQSTEEENGESLLEEAVSKLRPSDKAWEVG